MESRSTPGILSKRAVGGKLFPADGAMMSSAPADWTQRASLSSRRARPEQESTCTVPAVGATVVEIPPATGFGLPRGACFGRKRLGTPVRRGDSEPEGEQAMKIQVVIHEAEEGGYWAEVPAIPGCATQGETFEELLQNLYEAIEGCLSVQVEKPKATGKDRVLEIAVRSRPRGEISPESLSDTAGRSCGSMEVTISMARPAALCDCPCPSTATSPSRRACWGTC